MMKQITLAAALISGVTLPATQVYAKDACTTALCMFGVMKGAGVVSGCGSAVADYFNILPYHHGHIDFSAMPKQRLDFLNGCPSTSQDGTNQKINNAYGGKTSL
jgi:hypothetical protein